MQHQNPASAEDADTSVADYTDARIGYQKADERLLAVAEATANIAGGFPVLQDPESSRAESDDRATVLGRRLPILSGSLLIIPASTTRRGELP